MLSNIQYTVLSFETTEVPLVGVLAYYVDSTLRGRYDYCKLTGETEREFKYKAE